MANTRFNYDEARTGKRLDESTGPGRYVLITGRVKYIFQGPLYDDTEMGWKFNGRQMDIPLILIVT